MKTKHISDSSFRLTTGLALKNLTRQKRRNAVLAIAIAFGFFVVTTVDGLVTGMVKNLENQITQMMGGTVLIQGIEIVRYDDESKKPSIAAVVRDSDYIRNLVEKNVKDYDSFSCYSIIPGQMIFEGKKSLSTMYGRNLTEKTFVESLQFASGGPENFGMYNPLIISDKTAEAMNIAVGDLVTFSCETIYGQNNVDDFTVAGIIKSNSFLSSMQTYTDIAVLNKLIEIPEASYSTFTVNLKNKNRQTKVANMIEELIRKDGVNVTVDYIDDMSITYRKEDEPNRLLTYKHQVFDSGKNRWVMTDDSVTVIEKEDAAIQYYSWEEPALEKDAPEPFHFQSGVGVGVDYYNFTRDVRNDFTGTYEPRTTSIGIIISSDIELFGGGFTNEEIVLDNEEFKLFMRLEDNYVDITPEDVSVEVNHWESGKTVTVVITSGELAAPEVGEYRIEFGQYNVDFEITMQQFEVW